MAPKTTNGTATAGNDYTALGPATLTFNPSETSQTVTVPVLGDTLDEHNEYFFIDFFNPVNAGLPDNRADGTILDARATSVQSPGDDRWWARPLSVIALVALVAWVTFMTFFIGYVAWARWQRSRGRVRPVR